MAKDPAFLFYPGDYLRDTQCLSENSQVAYDRIMCEHMRNICIRQAQLNFFTKRLNEDELQELKMVLSKNKDGYYIEWVVLSIEKRKAYSESRRKNRQRTYDKDMKTYDKDMENENENINKDKDIKEEDYKRDKEVIINIVKRVVFKIPTVKEVDVYFKEINFNHDANDFVNFYQSKGWMIGKNKMQDWKAAARHWKSKEPKEYGKSDKAFTELEKACNTVDALKVSYPKRPIQEIIYSLGIGVKTKDELIKIYMGGKR